MIRSHVIMLNPTPEQEVYFRKACGVARHAYNWALARWKEARTERRRVKLKDLKAEYNMIKGEQFPWCYEVTKCAPEQAFADLGQAFAKLLVDRWYPSSKTCSKCGWIRDDLTLAERVFTCQECGLVIDRDHNTAINSGKEALRMSSDVPVVASSERKIACGAERSGSEHE